MMWRVTVFLFSEMNDEGDIVPIQYDLNDTQVDYLGEDIKEKVCLIRFGNVLHHTDDIIRINIVEVSE